MDQHEVERELPPGVVFGLRDVVIGMFGVEHGLDEDERWRQPGGTGAGNQVRAGRGDAALDVARK